MPLKEKIFSLHIKIPAMLLSYSASSSISCSMSQYGVSGRTRAKNEDRSDTPAMTRHVALQPLKYPRPFDMMKPTEPCKH